MSKKYLEIFFFIGFILSLAFNLISDDINTIYIMSLIGGFLNYILCAITFRNLNELEGNDLSEQVIAFLYVVYGFITMIMISNEYLAIHIVLINVIAFLIRLPSYFYLVSIKKKQNNKVDQKAFISSFRLIIISVAFHCVLPLAIPYVMKGNKSPLATVYSWYFILSLLWHYFLIYCIKSQGKDEYKIGCIKGVKSFCKMVLELSGIRYSKEGIKEYKSTSLDFYMDRYTFFKSFFSIDYFSSHIGKSSLNFKLRNESLTTRMKSKGNIIQTYNKSNIFITILICLSFMIFLNNDNVLAYLKWLVLIRTISRSVEIVIAFYTDVIDNNHKSSNLTSYDRIKLASFSLFEIIILYGLMYMSFSKDNSLFDSFFRSFNISTLVSIDTDFINKNSKIFNFTFRKISLSLNISKIIIACQILTSIVLIVFSVARYIGEEKAQNEYLDEDEKLKLKMLSTIEDYLKLYDDESLETIKEIIKEKIDDKYKDMRVPQNFKKYELKMLDFCIDKYRNKLNKNN